MNFFSLLKRNIIYNLKRKVSIDSDKINFESLDELFNYYGSDKANIFKKTNRTGHGYSQFYEKKLKNFENKKINILEIGSYSGASAASFIKYIPGSNIFCFDINISNFVYKSKKIHVYGIDINNERKVRKTLNHIFKKFKIEGFDIIIDDGSHKLSDILIGFKFFFKFLKTNGLFVIEDFKHPNYYNYNNNINHIFVDKFLNNLVNNKISQSNIFSNDEQTELIKSIKIIEIFKGNLDDSDISFITKK